VPSLHLFLARAGPRKAHARSRRRAVTTPTHALRSIAPPSRASSSVGRPPSRSGSSTPKSVPAPPARHWTQYAGDWIRPINGPPFSHRGRRLPWPLRHSRTPYGSLACARIRIRPAPSKAAARRARARCPARTPMSLTMRTAVQQHTRRVAAFVRLSLSTNSMRRGLAVIARLAPARGSATLLSLQRGSAAWPFRRPIANA
jgi:hypothetical protein